MATIKLPILDLRDYQKPLWNYMLQNRPGLRAVSVWPRRCGKDLSAINILAAKALQRKGLYLYIAPFANQVRSIIWEGSDGTGSRFIDYVPREIITRKLDQSMKLWLSNGSVIHLLGSDNPDAIVGTNPLGIVFTEFSLHKEAIWGYMRPILAENGGWALFNGTPRGMNHFYQMAKMAEANPSWFYERLTADDTGYPSKEDIEEERQAGMPESLIEQEFYTSWVSSSEETLIPLDKIQLTVENWLEPAAYSFAPRIIGVDPAYAEKGDRAVIVRRQGRKVWEPEAFQGIDPMALATRVATHIREWKAHYVFVDAGRGEAVWSRLYQLGYGDRVIPVNFSGKTYDPLCFRKKDEIWNRLKQYICSPLTPDLPDHSDLIRDISAPTFKINDRGLLEIESKQHLKDRGFRSTDYGDALALTFSEELDEADPVPQALADMGMTQNDVGRIVDAAYHLDSDRAPYDPLNYMQNLGSYGFS